jgi:hypothetical protein
MYTIDNPLQNPRFMAATTRAHLRLINAGMTPPRGIRKADVLNKAANLTGKPYKRGEYKAAIADLTALLETIGWEGVSNAR